MTTTIPSTRTIITSTDIATQNQIENLGNAFREILFEWNTSVTNSYKDALTKITLEKLEEMSSDKGANFKTLGKWVQQTAIAIYTDSFKNNTNHEYILDTGESSTSYRILSRDGYRKDIDATTRAEVTQKLEHKLIKLKINNQKNASFKEVE